ncbi:MAG: hypothetical protein GY941_01705 [Planctomycetes bacterium]|nr:hypothetical protein [Planctomycetota bacterium]
MSVRVKENFAIDERRETIVVQSLTALVRARGRSQIGEVMRKAKAQLSELRVIGDGVYREADESGTN